MESNTNRMTNVALSVHYFQDASELVRIFNAFNDLCLLRDIRSGFRLTAGRGGLGCRLVCGERRAERVAFAGFGSEGL